MLELKNICFSRDGKEILKDINLKIEDKRFVAITGPNGSGKSTLAKIIMGIEKQDSGIIEYNGEDISNLTIDKRANLGISFAFQQPVKFKGISVKDLINLGAGENLKFEEIKGYLSDVGLCAREYIEREINSSLSGGELKRIELASVVARKSKLTIFDEPEAGIDLWSFNNLINVFDKMHKNVDGSIVIISHQERILDIADEIIVIKNGVVVEQGNKLDILPGILNKSVKCKYFKEASNE